MGREESIVRKDELVCDLIAPENFRFDPMCDWRDPAKSSPYLIYMMPVYAGAALENMETVDPKTNQPMWKKHSLGAIMGTRRQDYDRTRQAREGRERIDPADEQHGNAFTTLWAHFNIITVNGEDIAYWTMGTELLLTDPVPLVDLYPHLARGERPFVVGFSTIDAFRNDPAGDVEQIAGIVRLAVFVNSSPGFTDQAQVANGASDFLVELLGDAGRHVRAAVGVSELPLNAAVELELTARLRG